jgi:hypothetical protein
MSNVDNRTILDDIVSASGIGRPNSALTDIFWGLDHQGVGTLFPKNSDEQGMLLVTRPRMNLSHDNVTGVQKLTPLLSDDRQSIYRAIRCMLDPIIGAQIGSDLFDIKQAFIPIITNTCISCTGWPEATMNYYTSPEGIRKEVWSMADDVAELNGTYQLTMNFANTRGDPVSKLMLPWVTYQGAVYTGDMTPYPEHSMLREMDYWGRIWRIVLSEDKRYVSKIGCMIGAVPMADSTGAFMDYNREDGGIRNMDQISIPFHCLWAEYDVPVLLEEFNLTVCMFNGAMRDGSRQATYRKMTPFELATTGSMRGYPHIDLVTREITWWI